MIADISPIRGSEGQGKGGKDFNSGLGSRARLYSPHVCGYITSPFWKYSAPAVQVTVNPTKRISRPGISEFFIYPITKSAGKIVEKLAQIVSITSSFL